MSFIYKKSIRASPLRQTCLASGGAASSKKDVRPRAGIVEYAEGRPGKFGDRNTTSQQNAKIHQYCFVRWKEKLDIAEALAARLELERNTPERRIRLSQLESGVPRFVVPPDDQRFGLAASFRMDQSNLLVHR